MPALLLIDSLTMSKPTAAFLRVPALLAGIVLFLASVVLGEVSWFSRNGPVALHQRCLDMERPAVAMIVALQPGFEDLPLMAYLRTHQGIRTVVVFMTNGEATPGDSLGRFPVWMTGERKAEADRVASLLDADAWFANIPDVPGSGSAIALSAVWDTLGATRRLRRAIRKYQPDVLILCGDRRVSGSLSSRDTVLLATVREAVATASTTLDTSRSASLLPWSVSRVFVQTESGTLPRAFERRHPLLKVSSRAMAMAASRLYRTLRLQIGSWATAGRGYRLLGQAGSGRVVGHPDEMLEGLPRIGAKMTGIDAAIRAAVQTNASGIKSAGLVPTSNAINATEHVLLNDRGSLTSSDKRVMITWKNGLEALRCAVLGIDIRVTPSDSLLTTSQLWFLQVAPVTPRASKGTTEIIFPLATTGDWTINETLNYHFPLDSSTRFSVLTAPEMPFTVPAADYGLVQPVMNMKFPYVVVHKDAKRERNYMYHGSVTFYIGPRRSFTLHTPLVFDDRLSPVIFEMQNFSRDAFGGAVTLSDTAGRSTQHPVSFARKDEIHTDTLYLPSDAPYEEGRRLAVLELSGKGGRRSITAQRFRVAHDSTARTGLLSMIDSSPLADALRVLQQPHETIDLASSLPSLEGFATLLLDRDVLSVPHDAGDIKHALARWITDGGNAVVFPQHGEGARWLESISGASFARIDPLPPQTGVTVDSSALFALPNRVEARDWEDWVQARAFESVRQTGKPAGSGIRARSGSCVLLLTVPIGKGSVTLVGMDLTSQLVNYHAGAFRLLANLIAYRHRER